MFIQQSDPGLSPLTSKPHHLSVAVPPPHTNVHLMSGQTTWFSKQGRHDRAGHRRERKTKSQISQTLYQSNILEAQSHYLQESHWLQREMCEGFFFLASEHRIVVDQRQCLLSFVVTSSGTTLGCH